MKLDMDYEWLSDEPIIKEISSNCDDMFTAEVLFKNDGCMLPRTYLRHAERIRNLEVRPDDVWVISFPKCG